MFFFILYSDKVAFFSSCLCVTNLFITLNYLFALYIKLLDDVDLLVRNIHFLLFILSSQMFTLFNIFVHSI